jgi:catalase
MKNPTQLWDFCCNHPEGLHQFLMIYSDRIGTPMSYRTMDAYGCHTFSFINSKNEKFWVKFHILSQVAAERKGLTAEEAILLSGQDLNFLTRDLYTSIEKGDYPKWKMFFQVMNEEEGYAKANIAFDPTKIWKHDDYPLIEIGEIELNQNVKDFYCETEQAAFSPATLVPGIGLSLDRLLLGRLLIYDDSQHHRLGPNFKQLPVNCPKGLMEAQEKGKGSGLFSRGKENDENAAHTSVHICGAMNFADHRNHYPHYSHSEFGTSPAEVTEEKVDFNFQVPNMKGSTVACNFYSFPGEGSDEDYYEQPRDFYQMLSEQDQKNLCNNLAISFELISYQPILDKMLMHLGKVDPKLRSGVEEVMSKRSTIGDNHLRSELLLHSMKESHNINTYL